MEDNKLKRKKTELVIIAVLLVIVVAAIVVLLVTGKKDTDKKEEPVSMSFDDYVNDAKEYESEGDKDKAYNSYLEAYKLNKSSEEVLDYLIDNTEDVTLKLNYVYEYLDLTAESSKGSDRRRELFDYLFDSGVKEGDDNEALYEMAEYADKEFEGYLKTKTESGEVKERSTAPVLSEDGKVYFGSYPQNKIADGYVTDYIKNAKYDENDTAVVFGKKITRVNNDGETAYFTYGKIAWMLLIDKDNEYLLMTDKVLDGNCYMNELVDSSWDVSELRTWLNTSYLSKAFSDEELNLIKKTHIGKPENYFYSTSNGNESEDYLVILSCNNLVYSEYGLRDEDVEKRQAKATDYAIARGVFVDENNGAKWWTSSNGSMNTSYVFVNSNGIISAGGELATNTSIGVRPVMTVSK